MKTHCVVIKIKSSEAEKLSYALWDLPGVLGIEEAPLNGQNIFSPGEDFEILEFGSEAARKCAEWMQRESYRPQGMMLLKIYVDSEQGQVAGSWEKWLSKLPSKFFYNFEREEILEDKDYLQAYKDSVQGSELEHGLFIGPPWSKVEKTNIDHFIVEPGLAFGTGDHPTTQLCLERIKEYSLEKRWSSPFRSLDLGAGTGVLGLATKRYFPQAELVLADYDPLCKVEIEKTFSLNEFSLKNSQIFVGDEGSIQGLKNQNLAPFDFIVSNIYAEVLASHVKEISTLLKDKGLWLMSGILAGKPEETLQQELKKAGFAVLLRRDRVRQGAIWKEGELVQNEEHWVLLEVKKEN